MFRDSSFELVKGGVKVNLVPKKDVGRQMIVVAREFLDVNNSLEAFSGYFTSGAADEKIAFKAIGATYTSSVKKYLPLLVTLGEKSSFQNIIELYLLWQNRLDEQSLSDEKDKIERRLKDIDKNKIIPIGTE